MEGNAVGPKIYIVAETSVNRVALHEVLHELGVKDHSGFDDNSAHALTEFCGRLCYMSFQPGLNKNVTRIRQDNKEYIKNILQQEHFSVLEHSTVTVAFLNVTRIFTHEIVRHRVGTAFSQESLRYVRLEGIKYRLPTLFEDDIFMRDLYAGICKHAGGSPTPEECESGYEMWANEVRKQVKQTFADKFADAEAVITNLSNLLQLDLHNFAIKKAVTSALRRLVPDGLSTKIVVTANHHAWRHMIKKRAIPKVAEEEIYQVFMHLGGVLKARYPAIYQDMNIVDCDGYPMWKFDPPASN